MSKMIGRFEYRIEVIFGYLLVIMVLYFLGDNALNAIALQTVTRSNNSINTTYTKDPQIEQDQFVKNQTQENGLSDRVNNTRILAEIFEGRVNRIATLLESTSREPDVRNISFSSMISSDVMGIPKKSDIGKRKIADSLLDVPGVGSVYFTLQNGDVYLGEPYLQQEQLPRLNFADRDWYKGVTKTNETYISSVFISASIHAPAIAIAVPVYGDESKTTALGYWVGIVNIEKVWKSIIDKFVPDSEELIVFDDKGVIVFKSGQHNYSGINIMSTLSRNISYTYYDNKTTPIKLQGNQLAVSYPIKVGSRTWLATTIK
jgi:hypothetical protein